MVAQEHVCNRIHGVVACHGGCMGGRHATPRCSSTRRRPHALARYGNGDSSGGGGRSGGARPARAREWVGVRPQCGGTSAGEWALDVPPWCVCAICRVAAIARPSRKAQCRPGRSQSSLPSRSSWRSCRSWKQASGWIRFLTNGPHFPGTRAHVQNLSWWCKLCSASITRMSGNTSRPDLLHRRRRSRGGGLAWQQ